jgi:DNA-binding PadR family transcriptional regulator
LPGTFSEVFTKSMTSAIKRIEKDYIEFFYKDLYNRKGGRRKRFYKIAPLGMEALEEVLELQRSLWKGFPKFAAEK